MATATSGMTEKRIVYFLNYIEGCSKDVEKMSELFQNLGYLVTVLPPGIDSYLTLKVTLSECSEKYDAVVVFFFGYGYGNYHLFMGCTDKESLSYKTFSDAFNVCRGDEKPLAMFTNTCIKAKTENTVVLDNADDFVDNVYHYCARIKGNCQNGCLITDAILKGFNARKGAEKEFCDLTLELNHIMHDLRTTTEEQYLIDTRCYGVKYRFYFSCSAKNKRESESSSSSSTDQSSEAFDSSDCV